MKKLLLLLTLALPRSANAYDFKIDGIYYNIHSLDNKTVEVTYGDTCYCDTITIPSSINYNGCTFQVDQIGEKAFYNNGNLKFADIPKSITVIGDYAFQYSGLKEITISENVTSIGYGAFSCCYQLKNLYYNTSNCHLSTGSGSIYFKTDLPGWSSLTNIVIGSNVEYLPSYIFYKSKIEEIHIPSSVKTIGEESFKDCPLKKVEIEDLATWCSANVNTESGLGGKPIYYNGKLLTNLIIPEGVTTIKEGPFKDNTDIDTLTIPQSIKSLNVPTIKQLKEVYCLAETPISIENDAFYDLVFLQATLHVPTGSLNKYQNKSGWKKFNSIVEGNDVPLEDPVCDTPTMIYKDGKIILNCNTEGSNYHYSINANDEQSTYKNTSEEINLSGIYNISVYATANGYKQSEIINATICWINCTPEGTGDITIDAINNVKAQPILIQSNAGQLNISGIIDDGTVEAYNTSGQLLDRTVSSNGTATLKAKDKIVIIKVGDKSIKVLNR